VAPYDWDDEPVGEHDTGVRRNWRRGWHQYAAIMLAMVGVFVLIGAFRAGPRPIIGAVLLLLASVAVVLADGPRHRPPRPKPDPPSPRVEAAWTGLAVVLVVVGLVLVAV
jgi:drug/metabolite transporter (DMT)-like permease